MTNQYEIRPISDKEFGKFSETSARAFGFDQDDGYLSLKKSYFDFFGLVSGDGRYRHGAIF